MKKKMIQMIVGSSLSLPMLAATYMIVEKNDGSFLEVNVKDVNEVVFVDKDDVPVHGDTTSHDTVVVEPYEYVDLGLPSGTLWATCNLGATKPEEVGYEFAWGETTPKTSFSIVNYTVSYYKYTDDSLHALVPGDDAATVILGEEWQMPTKENFKELVQECWWNYKEVNGVLGSVFTAKNGKSIFIPGDDAVLWGKNTDSFKSGYVFCFETNKYGPVLNYYSPRYLGRSVRPVRVNKSTDTTSTIAPLDTAFIDSMCYNAKYVDLGLPGGLLWATYNVGASLPEEVGDFFAYGETETKTIFNENTYKWQDSLHKYIKYNSEDKKDELDKEDDPVAVNWGNGWRLPTYQEYRTLVNCTKQVWVEINGRKGMKFIAANGNWVFFPVTGFRMNDYEMDSKQGCYWGNYVRLDDEKFAMGLNVRETETIVNYFSRRYFGLTVRGVRDFEISDPIVLPDTTAAQKDTFKYVDLGLPSGTLWATCNIGASSPEQKGNYYAWGETEPKSTYTKENYKFYDEEMSGEFSKYNYLDRITTLKPEDDAATVNWGSEWRMPTQAECKELTNNCTAKEDTINGVVGTTLTGKNGNSIFLPAAGYSYEDTVRVDDRRLYWSSQNSETSRFQGLDLENFGTSTVYYSNYRACGELVRAVRKKKE